MEVFIKVISALGVFSILMALYIGSYLLNKRTKRPDGCEDLTASCTGCAITTCGHYEGEDN